MVFRLESSLVPFYLTMTNLFLFLLNCWTVPRHNSINNNFLVPEIEEEGLEDMQFHEDGAKTLSGFSAIQLLNDVLPRRLILKLWLRMVCQLSELISTILSLMGCLRIKSLKCFSVSLNRAKMCVRNRFSKNKKFETWNSRIPIRVRLFWLSKYNI